MSFLPYPEHTPSHGFGLYPCLVKSEFQDDYLLLYYYPDNQAGERWQDDMVVYDDIVISFLDIAIYPEVRIEEEK